MAAPAAAWLLLLRTLPLYIAAGLSAVGTKAGEPMLQSAFCLKCQLTVLRLNC